MREGAASTLSTSTPRVLVCSLAWELLPGETGQSCVSGGERAGGSAPGGSG